MIKLGNDWDEFLDEETQKAYYLDLRLFLKEAYSKKTIYPPMYDIFSAFKASSIESTKVVILGQDPYINPGEAHGMAFSVLPSANIPPSLRNIFKELNDDLGCRIPNHGHLQKWAAQGILLLNTALTVEAKKSKSHAGIGWERFTTSVIQKLNQKESPIVFLLWGKDAQEKAKLVTNPKHLILAAAHPSPLAGGRFFGCRHFSKTNEYLRNKGLAEIDWQIENI